MTHQRPTLSVVVPCYNEQESIRACHERLTGVLSSLDLSYEIIYVNDGSRDFTAAALNEIHEEDSHAVIVHLSRNFGHQSAVTAGLSEALGEAVVIIDADLQDPPELIPEMLRLWREGYKVVYGVRTFREGESRFKLWTAKCFYRLINSVSDVEIPLDTGDFRLVDRVVLQAFQHMPEQHRLLRGMWSWLGYRQIGLPYERSARFAGESKYPLRKMLTLAADGIISFSTVPLRLVSVAGFAVAGMAFLGILYSLCVRVFTHSWVRGWAISFIGMLFMSGMQMLFLGVLGEYIGRIYTESKRRPLFLSEFVLRKSGEDTRQSSLDQEDRQEERVVA